MGHMFRLRGLYPVADKKGRQEHRSLSRVELLSAAEVGDLSHEITSVAAAISLIPLREARPSDQVGLLRLGRLSRASVRR